MARDVLSRWMERTEARLEHIETGVAGTNKKLDRIDLTLFGPTGDNGLYNGHRGLMEKMEREALAMDTRVKRLEMNWAKVVGIGIAVSALGGFLGSIASSLLK